MLGKPVQFFPWTRSHTNGDKTVGTFFYFHIIFTSFDITTISTCLFLMRVIFLKKIDGIAVKKRGTKDIEGTVKYQMSFIKI